MRKGDVMLSRLNLPSAGGWGACRNSHECGCGSAWKIKVLQSLKYEFKILNVYTQNFKCVYIENFKCVYI